MSTDWRDHLIRFAYAWTGPSEPVYECIKCYALVQESSRYHHWAWHVNTNTTVEN